ncbi:APM1 (AMINOPEPTIDASE M1), putative [Acanthamoeba castellanii str. Neff]|uniref:APM1 (AMINOPEPTIDASE M1), putative n=1 Tax=Acanthamoeba castellanii (strain ATCC 30010 / Neff) TaxID=1257118 RepID=L8GWV6_ACACF|nr:APM1 (AMINOPEPTIDASE M1), putative [Acanthamoeba castellanii str. Neff]ELR17053.1 APM1 (AMINOPEPTIDASE M1), putative [Acanthamoeba castellanii str. Neff]
MRCYTPVGKTAQGHFALSVGVRALSYFTKIFGIPYPLPKLDMVAITEFAAGAMENWGLVTYREAALLIDVHQSSAGRKQGVARTVSHELAHQWFGNLVTMDWWTWLYLNEGFARWVEHLSVNHLFPEWDIWTQFVTDVRGSATSLDAMRSSHAIEVDVHHPAEINEIFDTISYAKGGTVIRMLSFYLTEEVFLKGLNLYLTRHSYANATSDDLWSALEEASGKPVRDIMNSWTKQVGYPVLSFEEVGHKENKTVFKVRQTRFLSNGEKDDEPVWSVPVGIIAEKKKDIQFFLISQREQEIEVEVGKDEWMKVNAGMTGMFRVKYPQERLKLLGAAVQSKAFSAADRLGIQDDLYALAKAGLGSIVDYLGFLANYQGEDDYSVVSDIATNLAGLELLLKKISLAIFRPIKAKLGWDPRPDDSHLTQLFRALVISRLSSCDDPETVAEAKQRFERYLAGPASLAPDLRFTVYKSVIAHGGVEEYEAVLKLFRQSDFSEEQRRCLQAFGATRVPELLVRTLDFALSEEVRTSDVPFPVASVSSNPAGRDIAWQYMKDKWVIFDKKFGGGLFIITSIVGTCTNYFTTEEKAKDIEARLTTTT